MLTDKDKRGLLIGAGLAVLLGASWAAAFLLAPVDQAQGQVYRIMYLHVPSAFTAFLSSLMLFIASIVGLRNKSESSLRFAKATAEVGFLFTILTLMTGSIWGKPTWGVWWTWDARLTTTFLLGLLYAGYLILHATMPAGPGRIKACSVLGILIFADVPIIYKSVTWWRTLHQPPSMLRPGGAAMDSEILNTLLICIAIMCAFGLWLMIERTRNLAIKDEIESLSLNQLES